MAPLANNVAKITALLSAFPLIYRRNINVRKKSFPCPVGEGPCRFTMRIEHGSCKMLKRLPSCHLIHYHEDNWKEFRKGHLNLLRLAEFSLLGQMFLKGRTHPTNIHSYQAFSQESLSLCRGSFQVFLMNHRHKAGGGELPAFSSLNGPTWDQNPGSKEQNLPSRVSFLPKNSFHAHHCCCRRARRGFGEGLLCVRAVWGLC